MATHILFCNKGHYCIFVRNRDIMKLIVVGSLFMLSSIWSYAQERDSVKTYPVKEYTMQIGGESVSYHINSPYNTIYTHLKFLQPDSYYPAIAAKTFNINEEARARELAIQLKQILLPFRTIFITTNFTF